MIGREAAGHADSLLHRLGNQLRSLIADVSIGADFEVSSSAELCYGLELVLPQCLRERYPEWENESLDGLFVARAKKTGDRRAEIVGTTVLITDQTVTPFLAELEATPSDGPMTVCRLQIGEPGGGMLGISGPRSNSEAASRLLMSLVERIDRIEWSYVLSES